MNKVLELINDIKVIRAEMTKVERLKETPRIDFGNPLSNNHIYPSAMVVSIVAFIASSVFFFVVQASFEGVFDFDFIAKTLIGFLLCLSFFIVFTIYSTLSIKNEDEGKVDSKYISDYCSAQSYVSSYLRRLDAAHSKMANSVDNIIRHHYDRLVENLNDVEAREMLTAICDTEYEVEPKVRKLLSF